LPGDQIIPLSRLPGAELRVGVDRAKPWVWLMFVTPDRRDSYPLGAREDIDALTQTIVRTRTIKRAETYQCQLKPDHLIQFHPDRHPEDAKAEGETPGVLWVGFHNLRRSHESRVGRRAPVFGEEIGALIAALEGARDTVLRPRQ
jgi:hypothetical protein